MTYFGGVYYLVQWMMYDLVQRGCDQVGRVYDLVLRAWVCDLDGRGILLSSGGGV